MNRDDRETMPRAEFKRIRQKLKLSLDEFAIELGYEGNRKGNIKTMRRFESGQRGIPLTLGKLVWMFDVYGLPDSWPENLEAKLAEVPEDEISR
jgi:transcriptional regulator with XRE-family HTH domain